MSNLQILVGWVKHFSMMCEPDEIHCRPGLVKGPPFAASGSASSWLLPVPTLRMASTHHGSALQTYRTRLFSVPLPNPQGRKPIGPV